MSNHNVKKSKKAFPPKLADVEKVLGPARDWAGRCFEIASRMVALGFVEGIAVYGHWIGKVDPLSHFGARSEQVPFIPHGWVHVRGDRNLILDPTRWAFTGEDPFIYFGPNEGEYDEGGNVARQAMRAPCPPFDGEGDGELLPFFSKNVLSTVAWSHVEKMLGPNYLIELGESIEPGTVTMAQLYWLANAPYGDLEPHNREIYLALEKLGNRAAVPIDNWLRAEREAVRR